jgi:hypothetical protein
MIARSWRGAVRNGDAEAYETAVFYPEDDRYLVQRDPKCTHWEVVRSADG